MGWIYLRTQRWIHSPGLLATTEVRPSLYNAMIRHF
jgi:hypothetical protein